MTDGPTPIVLEDDEVLTTWGEVPEGWEARSSREDRWWKANTGADPSLFCIARPVRRKVEIEARHLRAYFEAYHRQEGTVTNESVIAVTKALES